MNLVVTVIGVVAPVFLLAGIGFGWMRLGFDYPLQFVSRLAMNLAVPALVFTALMQAEADLAALGRVALAAVLTGQLPAEARHVGVVFSGGNVDLGDLPWSCVRQRCAARSDASSDAR